MESQYFPKEYIEELYPLSGIYLLYETINGIKTLVYIGLSQNLLRRLKEHCTDMLKNFDCFQYMYYSKREIDRIERTMLLDYQRVYGYLPKYNKQLG